MFRRVHLPAAFALFFAVFPFGLSAQEVPGWHPTCLEELNYTVLSNGMLTVVQKNGILVRGKLVSIDLEQSSLTLNPITRVESEATRTFSASDIEEIRYGYGSKSMSKVVPVLLGVGLLVGMLADFGSGNWWEADGSTPAIGAGIALMGGLVLTAVTSSKHGHVIRCK